MSLTGLDVFDTTLQKTNKILKEIEGELDWIGRKNQAYLALRSVLHALRDRLPVTDSVHFSAQLPLLLKGVYFDGWNPEIVPVKFNRQEFLNYIGNQFKFDVEGGTQRIVKVVLDKVFASIEPTEVAKIINELPSDITSLFC